MAKITAQSITKILEEKGYRKATKVLSKTSSLRSGILNKYESEIKGDFQTHRDKNGNITISFPSDSKLSSTFGEERNERLNNALKDSGLIVGTQGNIVEIGSKYDPNITRGIGSTSTSSTGKK